MIDEARLHQLIDEILESGRTPEELCGDDPELLAELKRRLRRLRGVEAQIDALFPAMPPDAGELGGQRGESDADLPPIPGYAVEAILGRGGMGVVYRARHLRLNREVALKMLISGAWASAHERQRFMREAESVAGLRHANIVQLHDIGDFDGRPYFTMELIEGGSLAQELAGQPRPTRDAARFLATLARAIDVAHKSGIVHRDLKPTNILLTADGTPKIADFGLARRFDGESGLTLSGSPVGTPSYMAPEQAAGQNHAIGPTTDVYALGAILYEMLTGRPPFRASSALQMTRMVLMDEPVPPSRLNARVSRDIETICLKCLQKNSSRRYASASALEDDLNRFLRGEPILARPIGRIERAWKWARRRPTRATILAGGLLAAITVLSAAAWFGWQRTVLARVAGEDLTESMQDLRASHWPEARVAMERARGRLGTSGPESLRGKIDEIDRDLHLVAALERLRAQRGLFTRQDLDNPTVDRDYEGAFEAGQIGSPAKDPERAAPKIAASPVKEALVAALDDWLLCRLTPSRGLNVLETARRADPDPSWRDRLHSFVPGDPRDILKDLSTSPLVDSQPLPALLLLANRMKGAGIDPAQLLRRVQLLHPGDFWVQFALGCVLDDTRDPGAIECYQAALAIRPGTVAVLSNLGTALASQRRFEEAYDAYERALQIDSASPIVHLNYAVALALTEQFEKAAEHAREAICLDPAQAAAHAMLGQVLWGQHRYAEARQEAQQARELAPSTAVVRASSAWIVQDCYRRLALERRIPAIIDGTDEPADASEAAELGQLCKERRQYRAAVQLFSDAFAASPALAEDLLSSHRLTAAAAAAELGRVGASDDAASTEVERANWRARAREWLHADLDLWTSTIEVCDTETRLGIRRRAAALRTDPCFAGLREEAQLKTVPPEERQDCAAIWRDVDALLYRIDQPK